MSRPYPTLKGDLPFAKEFNKRQGEYWVKTGNYLNEGDLAMHILIDDYNERKILETTPLMADEP